ncbi:hypothetical protein [Hydrogenophaga sp. OTU3427]|uniref:hypothetical protein n=1 Tax=Hydrogenophaga sp. OTU3427 TaxID=3043856 RepID=UPI00313BEF87
MLNPSPRWRLAPLACAFVASSLSFAPHASAAGDADAMRYRQDMLDCREGRTAQSRPDCEREARNARADARRGALSTPVDPAGQTQRRCAVFKQEDDHVACMARQGAGAQVSGSVEGGGLLREITTTVPAR